MNKKMLFVYNPKSGRSTIRERLTDVIGLFTAAGYDVLAHPTQAKGDAISTVRRFAREVDLVVCGGGDGTLDEVVTAVMETNHNVKVGYLPSGSTNDFASSLKIPKNIVRAAEAVVDGELYRCDVGQFNRQYFVYVAAFGAFTQIAYETSQNLKNTLGHFAYLTQAGAQVFNLPRFAVTGEVDGKKIAGTYMYGMVSNSRYVGGIKNITGPAVDMDDGLFELTLVHATNNPIELGEIINTLLSKKQTSPLVEVYKASHLVLRFTEKADWTLDGEFGGSHKRVEINNLHRVLRLYLQKR